MVELPSQSLPSHVMGSPFSIGVLVVTLAAAILLYTHTMKPSTKRPKDWTKELMFTQDPASTQAHDKPLKKNWEDRWRNGTASSSRPITRSTASEERPFGSSYYYAHNNPHAKGGYSDGLRMEDYTMNQPRLLSRSGVAVRNEPDEAPNPATTAETAGGPTAAPSRRVPSRHEGRKISNFLWDDPGESDGMATIRIESLPGEEGSGSTLWQDAQIVGIDAKLVDDNKGLLVLLESQEGNKYRLHIPKLYGEVESVRTISKRKRLLVRFHKKKNPFVIWKQKNLEAWPHP